MKVREVLEIIKDFNQNTEINVLLPLANRPYGGGNLEPIHSVKHVVDQDINKIKFRSRHWR
ncbi:MULTISPECIES: hypothetical protein [Bacillaceae]|uniref:hypothetical protein n=1 Tax=Bacillaceae TaxID=186817 RepID=UPI001E397C67|nr:hypothetical protein [Bacillus sp. Au-Bac7]MCE4048959.1 hypothetical protein [Bacillus sp. Au-Bac7]